MNVISTAIPQVGNWSTDPFEKTTQTVGGLGRLMPELEGSHRNYSLFWSGWLRNSLVRSMGKTLEANFLPRPSSDLGRRTGSDVSERRRVRDEADHWCQNLSCISQITGWKTRS